MKRRISLFFYFALLIAGALVVAEVGLRALQTDPAHLTVLRPRLWRLWGGGRENGPYLPPYDLSSNTGIGDDERLKRIFEKNRPTPNVDAESYDFLRPAELKEKTAYHMHFNNLGFRDSADREKKKPRGVFRIIALGSYHTLGHGLENDESFPARLEKHLNEKFKGRPPVEVWNGGRHAGTAIVGLARLKNEIFDYEPDLILLDYGMVDTKVVGDNFFPFHFYLPDHWLSDSIRGPVNAFGNLFGESRLVMAAMQALRRASEPRNRENFLATMKASVGVARDHAVPVVVIKNPQADVTDLQMNALVDENKESFFFSAAAAFEKHPPSGEDKRRYWHESNWSEEYGGPKALRIAEDPARFRPPEYLLNPFQYNARGQDALARGLSDFVAPHIERRRTLKPSREGMD